MAGFQLIRDFQFAYADLILPKSNRFRIGTDELIKIDFFLRITGVLFAHPDSNKG